MEDQNRKQTNKKQLEGEESGVEKDLKESTKYLNKGDQSFEESLDLGCHTFSGFLQTSCTLIRCIPLLLKVNESLYL